MTEDELVLRFTRYMERKRTADGNEYGLAYVKDKVSRLKRLLKLISVKDLENLTESKFISLIEKIISNFDCAKEGTIHSPYKDHLVALRYVYEMQTKKSAPRHVVYGGKIAPKYANKIQ